VKQSLIIKLEEMIEAKLKGRKLTVVQPKAKPKIVDLMEALQKSVQQTKRPVARAESQTRAATKLKKVK